MAAHIDQHWDQLCRNRSGKKGKTKTNNNNKARQKREVLNLRMDVIYSQQNVHWFSVKYLNEDFF